MKAIAYFLKHIIQALFTKNHDEYPIRYHKRSNFKAGKSKT